MVAQRFSNESIIRVSEDTFKEPRGGERGEEETPRGIMGRVRAWYRPQYDDNPELTEKERKGTARYFNGRLKRWQWITLHVLAVNFILFAITTPIMYFWAIPAIIQSQVEGADLSQISMAYLNLSDFSANSLSFATETGVNQKFLPFSISVTLGSMDAELRLKGTDERLAVLGLPEVTTNLGKPLLLRTGGAISIPPQDYPAVVNVVKQLSSTEGIKDLNVYVWAPLHITVFGITWYKKLPVTRTVPVGDVTNNVGNFVQSIPKFMLKSSLTDLKQAVALKQYGIQSYQLFSPLSSLPLSLAVKTLEMDVTDKGMTIKTTTLVQNPLVLQMQLKGMSLGLKLEDAFMGRFIVSEFTLVQDMNELALTLEYDATATGLDYNAASKAIGDTISKFLGEGLTSLRVSLVGPFTIPGTEFVERITDPLELVLPVDEILKSPLVKDVADLTTPEGIKSLLGKVNFTAEATSKEIRTSVNLVLPLKLPLPDLQFNYQADITVSGIKKGDDVLAIRIGNISLHYDEPTGLHFKADIVIIPVNTLEAAEAMAQIANPILANQESAAGIGGISITDPSTNHQFQWSKNLFQDTTLQLQLPGFDIEGILGNMTDNYTAVPVIINQMAVTQMTKVSGFEAAGSIGLTVQDFPKVTANFGYLGMDALAGDKDQPVNLMGVAFPKGMLYDASKPSNDLAVEAVIPKNEDIPKVAQQLVDALLKEDSPAAHLGVSGIKFGQSQEDSFITFSKVQVMLSTDKMKDIAKKMVKNAMKPDMVVVDGAGVQLKSATKLDAAVDSTVNNPLNVTANVGSVLTKVNVDGKQLTGVSLEPISLSLGKAPLSIGAHMELATGADGMAEKVAVIVDEVLNDKDLTPELSVTGLKLVPKGAAEEDPATIDQFSKVKVVITNEMVKQVTEAAEKKESPINLSKILPNKDTLKNFQVPAINSVSMETLPSASMAAALDFSYKSPLAISAAIPYFATDVKVEKTLLMGMKMEGLDLKRESGQMAPSLSMAFNQESEKLPDIVASLVSQFIDGSVTGAVGAARIFFGTSATETNDLLSKVDATIQLEKFDTTSIIEQAKTFLPIKLPTTLDAIQKETNFTLYEVSASTKPNKAMDVGASVGMLNKMKLSVKIGYVASDISISGAPFVGFQLPGLEISPSTQTNMMKLGMGLQFIETEATPKAVAVLFNNFLTGGPLSSSMGVYNLGLGASSSDTIRALSKVKVDVNMDSVIAAGREPIDLSQEVVKIVKQQIDGDKSGLVSLKGAAVGFKPGSVVNASAQASVNLGFKAILDIGYAGAKMTVDDIDGFHVSLPGMKVSEEQTAAIKADVAVQDTDALADKLGAVTRGYTATGNFPGMAGVQGMIFGVSPEDSIKSFSLISPSLRINDVVGPVVDYALKTLGLPASLDDLQKKFGVEVGYLNVATQPGKRLGVSTEASLVNPFSLAVSMGYAAADVGVSEVPFVSTELAQGLSIKPSGEKNDLKLNLAMQFQNDDRTPVIIGKLAEKFFAGAPLGSSILLSGLKAGYSSEDYIRAFRKMELAINPDKILLPTGKPIDFTGKVVEIEQGILKGNSTGLSLSSAAVAVKSGANIGVKAEAGVDISALTGISLPLTADFGYVRSPVGLDQLTAAVMSINGLKYDDTKVVNMDANVKVEDTPALQEKLKHVFESYKTQDVFPGTLIAGGVVFGSSAEDTVNAFSQVFVPLNLNSIAQPVADWGEDFVDKTLNKLTSDDFLTQLENGEMIKITEDVGVSLNKATLSFLPASVVGAGLDSTLIMPWNIALDVPYMGAGLAVDDVLAAQNDINGLKIGGKGNNSLALEALVNVQDNEVLAKKLQTVFDNYLAKDVFGAKIFAAGLSMGVSKEDRIHALEKVTVGIDMDKIAQPFAKKIRKVVDDMMKKVSDAAFIDDLLAGKEVITIGESFGVAVPSVRVGMKPGAVVDVGADVALRFPLNVFTTVPYLTAGVKVDEVPAAFNDISGIALQGKGKSSLNLGMLVKVADEPILGAKLKTVFDSYMQTNVFPSKLVLGGMGVGYSQEDHIKCLKNVYLGVDLDRVAQPIANLTRKLVDDIVTKLTSDDLLEQLENGEVIQITKDVGVALNNASVSFLPASAVGAALDTTLVMPWNIAADIPYMGAGLAIDDVLAALNDISGLKIGGKGNNSMVVGAQANVNDNDVLGQKLQAVFDNYLAHDVFGARINAAGLSMGVSKDDRIRALEQIQLGIDMDRVLQPFAKKIRKVVDDVMKKVGDASFMDDLLAGKEVISIGKNFGVAVKKIAMNLKSGAVVLAKADVDVRFPLNVFASVPYLTAGAKLDDVMATTQEISGMALQGKGKSSLSLGVNMKVWDEPVLADKLKFTFDSYAEAGAFPGKLMVGGAGVGYSQQDHIKCLKNVYLGVDLDKIAQPIANFTSKLVDEVLDKLAKEDLLDHLQNGGEISLGSSAGVTVKKASVAMAPAAVIDSSVGLGLRFGFNLEADLPYLSAGLKLDDVPAMNNHISGVKVTSGNTTLDLGIRTQVMDSDSLAGKIGVITQQFFENSEFTSVLKLGGARIGVSADDYIRALEGVYFSLHLNRLKPILGDGSKPLDIAALLKKFEFGMSKVDVGAAPQQTVRLGVDAQVSLPFPVTLDVGFSSMNLGIELIHMLDARFGKLQLVPGKNGLAVASELVFGKSSLEAKQMVAKLLKEVLKEGLGNTKERFTVNGVVFGYSDSDFIKAFSQAKISIPSASVLNKKLVDQILLGLGINLEDFDSVDKLMKKITINNGGLDASTSPEIKVDGSISVKDFAPSIHVSMPFINSGVTVSGAKIANAKLDGGLVIEPSAQKQLDLAVKSKVSFVSSPEAKSACKELVVQIAGSGNVTATVGAAGAQFGFSSDDFVDLMELADIAISVNTIATDIRKFVSDLYKELIGAIDGTVPSKYDVDISKAKIGMPDNGHFSVSVDAKILGIDLNNFSIFVPFASGAMLLNAAPFAQFVAKGFTFKDGVVTVDIVIGFESNDLAMEMASRMAVALGDVVFHYPPGNHFDLTMTLTKLHFGTEAAQVDTFEEVAVSAPLHDALDAVWKFVDKNRPVELGDIACDITAEGMDAMITLAPFPKKLQVMEVNIPSVTGAVVYKNGAIVDAYISDLKIGPGGPPKFRLVLITRFEGSPTIIDGLQVAAPRLLKWEDFAQEMSLGYAKIHTVADPRKATPEQTFTLFSRGLIEAPELILWSPLHVKPSISFKEGFGIDLDVQFNNPGALGINVGDVLGFLKIKDRELGKVMIRDTKLTNGNNGGVTKIKAQLRLSKGILNIFGIINDLIWHKGKFVVEFDTVRDGVHFEWLNRCLNSLPDALLPNLFGVILSLLQNTQIKLPFGLGNLLNALANKVRPRSENFIVEDADVDDDARSALSNMGENSTMEASPDVPLTELPMTEAPSLAPTSATTTTVPTTGVAHTSASPLPTEAGTTPVAVSKNATDVTEVAKASSPSTSRRMR